MVQYLTIWQWFIRLKIKSSCDPPVPFLDMYFIKMKPSSKKNLWNEMKTYNSIIYYSPKAKTTWVAIERID